MRKNSGSLFWLLTGATLGIAGGLLFAPVRGSIVRNMLTYRIRRYAEKLQELIKALANSKTTSTSQAKLASQEVINETIQKSKQLLADANELAELLEQS